MGCDEEKARRDATNNFALAWLNWQKLAASIDWRQQECSKNAPVWATVDVKAVIKNDLGIPQYPPLLLLQLDVLPFYELIIKSPAALQQYGHLPFVAVAFLGRHASNAASEGCHSVAKLVMSDKQMAMSPTTFSQFVMLRHSKVAIAALKEIYKDEAQHVAHDITARLCALPLERAVAADSESLDKMTLFSHPGTPMRNRTSRACR